MKTIYNTMKNLKKGIVAMVVMVAMSVNVQAQNDAITKFFSKYDNDPDFTQVKVTGKMFSLLTHIEAQDDDEQAIKDAMSSIEGLKILALDESRRSAEIYDEAFKLIPMKEYEELMSVRDDEGDMKFLIKENGGKIAELLMIAGGIDRFFILSLVGDIDLKAISKLSRHVDIDGFDNFRHLDKGGN